MKDKQLKEIENHFRKIMEALDLDLSDPSLRDTPRRVAEMYVNELFVGLDPAAFPKIALFPYEGEEGAVISVDGIEFFSTCEHHFLPIRGEVSIRYVPRDRIIGLSKIYRIVHYFAARPQVQERLGQEIANCLSEQLGTPDVSVQIRAQHDCLLIRGVRDRSGLVESFVQRGTFLQKEAKRRLSPNPKLVCV